MKIAIVCDWLVTMGGAEQVLKNLLECYPNADLFAVVDFFDETKRAEILKHKHAQTTYIQRFPFAEKYYRQYLPFMPMAIEQLDVSAYDLVISSSHAVAKGVLTGPDQIHISYVHSPMRYAWDLQHQYLRESGLTSGVKSMIARCILHKMRLWDLRTANGVDKFIANSNFIAKRIWKTYRRESDVIYPPVDTTQFTPGTTKEDYYMTASRMVPYKKMDLIVESFTHMPDKKLIVIGDGPDKAKIMAKAGKNIEFLGYRPAQELAQYLQKAKAFVFAAEEDFGIMPVEAQACGTPVIAYGKGGCLESINGLDSSNPTGIFFPEQSTKALTQAVKEFEASQEKFTPENCVANAARFSNTAFQAQIKQYISDTVTALGK